MFFSKSLFKSIKITVCYRLIYIDNGVIKVTAFNKPILKEGLYFVKKTKGACVGKFFLKITEVFRFAFCVPRTLVPKSTIVVT